MEIIMSNKISEKIKKLRNGSNPIHQKFLRDFAFAVSSLTQSKTNISKKVMGTENIYVLKVGRQYRVFYTIERNNNGEEVILLLDYFDREKYKNEHYGDLLKALEEYKKV